MDENHETPPTDVPEPTYQAGYADGWRAGRDETLARVDALVAALLPRVSPGELRLGEVQELRAAVAALKPE